MFDSETWAKMPFHFWTLTFFVFGSIVGSFLNVCIHRMPRGESIVSPPSHCPHCRYSIPWYLNVPLLTWLWLRGKCANCGAPISIRYFLVELLTGVMFTAAWVCFGHGSLGLVLIYCLMLAGFITATFIDFEHFIIPDEITIGGMVVGFICSFAVPELHFQLPQFLRIHDSGAAMRQSVLGCAVGGGVVYLILRTGKLLFGRQKVQLPPGSKIIFTEEGILLPDQTVPFEEMFYRKSDAVRLQAEKIELIDRCYLRAEICLKPEELKINEDIFDPENVSYMEMVTDRIVLPREAMGLGDVKFMAAIGAFLGWPAVVFSLAASSVIGAAVGIILIVLRKQAWSSRLPYGPYIALAAILWIFGGYYALKHWLQM